MRSVAIVVLALFAGCGKEEPPAPAPPASSAAVPIPDGPGSPQEAERERLASYVAGDPKVWWNGLSRADRDLTLKRCRFELDEIRKRDAKGQEEAARELGVSLDALLKMSLEDYVLAQFVRDLTPEAKTWANGVKVERAEQRGDLALVFCVEASGRRAIKAFVRENGAWKSSALTDELRAEEDRLNGR